MIVALAFVVGYLCGSIPFGVIFARLRGVNLQKVGSGNIGATNAARALGKGVGVLVLLCDAGKAIVPLVLARRFLDGAPEADWALGALGLGAVLGHMFPPWLRFRGGKGVATGLGVFLVLSPLAAGVAAAVWVALYALTRVSSVGSLAAVSLAPAVLYFTHAPVAYVTLGMALVPLIVWKHRDNIRRLVHRQESKV